MSILAFFSGTSGIPAWSVIFFIAGAAFWIVSMVYGWFREPWAWDRGFGVGLMVFAIGLRVIFGI
jgi:hypothetical protein